MHSNKLVILGFPRSGTKLLASIYADAGYHSFGEFFDVYSCNVIKTDNLLSSRRMGQRQLFDVHLARKKNFRLEEYGYRIESVARLKLFNQYRQLSPSVVTVWGNNIDFIPELMFTLADRYFICTRRKNKFEQLLSFLITITHKNFNGETVSTPVVVDLEMMSSLYYQLLKLESLQDNLIADGRGILVDFDELVSGKATLSVPYSVTSVDQHKDLGSLIINLSEVENWFAQLENESTKFLSVTPLERKL